MWNIFCIASRCTDHFCHDQPPTPQNLILHIAAYQPIVLARLHIDTFL